MATGFSACGVAAGAAGVSAGAAWGDGVLAGAGSVAAGESAATSAAGGFAAAGVGADFGGTGAFVGVSAFFEAAGFAVAGFAGFAVSGFAGFAVSGFAAAGAGSAGAGELATASGAGPGGFVLSGGLAGALLAGSDFGAGASATFVAFPGAGSVADLGASPVPPEASTPAACAGDGTNEAAMALARVSEGEVDTKTVSSARSYRGEAGDWRGAWRWGSDGAGWGAVGRGPLRGCTTFDAGSFSGRKSSPKTTPVAASSRIRISLREDDLLGFSGGCWPSFSRLSAVAMVVPRKVGEAVSA